MPLIDAVDVSGQLFLPGPNVRKDNVALTIRKIDYVALSRRVREKQRCLQCFVEFFETIYYLH